MARGHRSVTRRAESINEAVDLAVCCAVIDVDGADLIADCDAEQPIQQRSRQSQVAPLGIDDDGYIRRGVIECLVAGNADQRPSSVNAANASRRTWSTFTR
jgi:hypothetical protein